VFEEYWEAEAKYMCGFTNVLLERITPAAATVLTAGAKTPAIADTFYSNFNNPRDYWPWLIDLDEAKKWVAIRTGSQSL
jgi:hypothetical protein